MNSGGPTYVSIWDVSVRSVQERTLHRFDYLHNFASEIGFTILKESVENIFVMLKQPSLLKAVQLIHNLKYVTIVDIQHPTHDEWAVLVEPTKKPRKRGSRGGKTQKRKEERRAQREDQFYRAIVNDECCDPPADLCADHTFHYGHELRVPPLATGKSAIDADIARITTIYVSNGGPKCCEWGGMCKLAVTAYDDIYFHAADRAGQVFKIKRDSAEAYDT